MPWGAAIGAVGAIGGALIQKGAANKAGSAAANAAGASQQQLQQNYDATKADLQPYIDTGTSALGNINAVNSGNYTAFENSPDYQFTLQQGLQGLDRSAAAKGSLYSGGQSADILNYASGLADQNLNNYYNRNLGLAQLGQSSATSLGSIGTGNAAQQGSLALAGANAAGESAYNSANASSNLISGLTGIAGQYLGQQGTALPTTSSYGTPAAQTSAGLLGGAPYNGVGSTNINWNV